MIILQATSIFWMKRVLPYLFLLGIFAACKPDPKVPKWDVDVLSPLVHSRLEISDMVPDSNMQVSKDGLISLVYRTQLTELKPDEIVKPLSQEFENTINLQNINLGDRTIENFVTLGQLAKGGSPIGQYIIQNNGNQTGVPAFPNMGPKSFNVNATQYFQTVTLSSGTIDLSITNGLPVDLTNISFNLDNKNSGSTIFSQNIASLPAGNTYTTSINLSSTTIEGQLKAILATFDSPGSNGNVVTVDTSDRITVVLSLKDLKPTSATAIFPDQTLANDTDDTQVPTGHAELTVIHVKSGHIFIDANSTIEDPIQLQYIIPNAKQNGKVLDLNTSINGAPTGSVSQMHTEKDLTGYTVDLTGRPGQSNIYNSFYTILLGSIDSTGNLIHLSLDDSVFLHTGIDGLLADYGEGFLGKDTIQSTENTASNLFKPIQDGTFDLADAILSLDIENYIGAPISLKVNKLDALYYSGSGYIGGNPPSVLGLAWSKLGTLQLIPAAKPSAIGNKPLPGKLNIQIDQSTSNFDQLIETQPKWFKTDVTAYINGSLSSPNYSQFIYSAYGLKTWLSLEIPLSFSGSNILLTDTSSFDYTEFDKHNQLQQGELKLIADNTFPLQGTIDVELYNANGIKIGTLESTESVLAPTIDADGNSTEVKRSILHYPLDKEKIALLKKTTKLVYEVRFDTPSPPQKIRILQQNYLDLTLAGDLTIRTK